MDRLGIGSRACHDDNAHNGSSNRCAGNGTRYCRWDWNHFAIGRITRSSRTGRQRHARTWRRTGAHLGQRHSSDRRSDGSALMGVELTRARMTV